MKRIVLHGPLRDICPAGELFLDVKSAAEAIRALARIPGFAPRPDRPRLCLRAVGFNNDIELLAPTAKEEIHLIVDMSGGGGKSGFIKIIIGVALVALAIYTGGSGLPLFGTTISTGSLYLAGAVFILGGILELASPSPKLNGGDNGTQSKYFGNPANTVKIGTPIPLLYGKGQVYGQYISFDVVTDQLVMVDTAGAPPADFGPPTDAAAAGFQTGITLSWTPNASPHRTGTQVWRSFTADFASAELIFDSSTGGANPAETHFNDDLSFQISTGGPNIPAWYWFRSVSDAPGFSDYTPVTTGAGITATTGAVSGGAPDGGADNPGDGSSDPGDGSTDGSGGENNGDGGGDAGDGGVG